MMSRTSLFTCHLVCVSHWLTGVGPCAQNEDLTLAQWQVLVELEMQLQDVFFRKPGWTYLIQLDIQTLPDVQQWYSSTVAAV